MPSIINGLFSGRSGIASHGVAIAVVGDNISNASTIGYKRSRTEFEDIVAGGQTASKVVGSGSSVSAISNIFEQGTLEFTGRALDLAIDGNGYFVVSKNGQRLYTRAGNFRVDDEGFVVTQKGERVMGFPANGTGALEEINVNTISQSNIDTENVDMTGNLNANSDLLAGGAASIPTVLGTGANGTSMASRPSYADLSEASEFSTVVNVFDSLGTSHVVTVHFFHTAANTWVARGYVNSEDVDASNVQTGEPRQIGTATLTFDGTGARTNTPAITAQDFAATINWNNGAAAGAVDFTFSPFTQYSTSSNIGSISGDGNGIGAITSLNIDRDGSIFALLDNGQASIIGTIGMANFSNPEGLVRVGANFLQESIDSGAPIIGNPNTGTFGAVESGSIELSTVDIASEFVKLITLQRGFQANSRIITTINQLLQEIIQLA